MNALAENYCALYLSIVTDKDPDVAFSHMGIPGKRKYTPQDARTMLLYRKQGYKADNIAGWYGLNRRTVERWAESVNK